MLSSFVLDDEAKYNAFVTKNFKSDVIVVYEPKTLKNWLLSAEELPTDNIIIGNIGCYEAPPIHSPCGSAKIMSFYFTTKKGFGIELVKLASNYFDNFIASDRAHSDNTASKKVWQRIIKSGDWTEKKLNNFFVDDRGRKIFITVNADGTVTQSEERPENSKVIDDCQLAMYDISSVEAMLKNTGSLNAYKYNGSTDIQNMLKRHNEFAIEMYRESLRKKLTIGIIRPKTIENHLNEMSKKLWDSLYKGVI